jgi:aspartate aminotransferase
VMTSMPGGAFYLIARLPVEDAEDFAAFLLRDFALDNETVMISPAEGFYITKGLGRQEVRIAYVLREEDLRKSARIIAEALKAYKERRR